MELMLEIISRHKFLSDVKPSYIFSKVGGYIGRSIESDWVLPDKSKKVSRKHLLINSDGQHFYLEDLSSNGVLSNINYELIGKNERYKISHGDSFQVGDYVLQARLLKNPKVYNTPELDKAVDSAVIPDHAFLDLDPLVAMEQQELHNAKSRLGLHNDLLGESNSADIFMDNISDHNSAPLDAMLSVNAIPENYSDEISISNLNEMADKKELLNNNLNENNNFDNHKQIVKSSELDIFFEALGLEKIPEKVEERQQILLQVAELLKASCGGMIQALQNRADSENELRLPVTTIKVSGNNPFKFCTNSTKAINKIFNKNNDSNLDAATAIYAGFNDLHSHNLGIMAGSRAAVSAALNYFSPIKIEERLDSGGRIKINRATKLWKVFINLHNEIMVHDGLADFFLRDFARAYEMQVRTLKPSVINKSEGDLR